MRGGVDGERADGLPHGQAREGVGVDRAVVLAHRLGEGAACVVVAEGTDTMLPHTFP